MSTPIKRITPAEYAALVATATRDELLQVLSQYVTRPRGRPATGRLTAAEYQRRWRGRFRKIADTPSANPPPDPDASP